MKPAPRTGVRAWLAAGLALLAINALFGMENRFPTLWPAPAARVSFELIVALGLLAAAMSWRAHRWAWLLRGLAAVSTLWVVVRYLDVTVSAVFGRQVNLYWDARHLGEVAHMAGLSNAQLLAGGLVLVLAITALFVGLLRGWQAIGRVLVGAPVIRRGAIGLALLGSALFAAQGVRGLNTRAAFSMPVAPILSAQATLLASQLMPGRAASRLSPSPTFDAAPRALHGADVLLLFAESYGVVTLDDPAQAAALAPDRARLAESLARAGLSVVSMRVRSPTFAGASWLAHAALLSGVDTRDPGDYELLLSTRRPTLASHFKSHGWRTVSWQPGLRQPWPEGRFYGFDRYADADSLGYQGLAFGHWRIPDQASMALLQAQELAATRDPAGPRFMVFPTLASHAPFVPLAPYVPDWSRLLGKQAYEPEQLADAMAPPRFVQASDAYVRSIRYTFQWLGDYLSGPAPADLFTIVIGDHQPLASVSGPQASWDVPVHLISRDRRLLARFEALGFRPGLAPAAEPGESLPMQALTALLVEGWSDRPLNGSGTAE